MSSQRDQEFIAERTRLLERIKELEAENAKVIRVALDAGYEPKALLCCGSNSVCKL